MGYDCAAVVPDRTINAGIFETAGTKSMHVRTFSADVMTKTVLSVLKKITASKMSELIVIATLLNIWYLEHDVLEVCALHSRDSNECRIT